MNFVYIKEWFDQLDFKIDAIYQDYNKEKEESIYMLNGELVYIEAKNEVRPQNISMFLKHRSKKLPLMIASKYITPKAKTMLKEQHINYIDSFGNAFINLNHLKLYIEQGNAKPVYGTKTNKAFTKSGAQVIFQLLKDSDAVNSNHRDIAKKSKVSLGTVSNAINGLFDAGYLVKWKNEKSYQLINKEKLLEKWITIINEKTLPAFFIGRYRMSGINANNYKNINLDNQAFWSGEPAAAELTNYLNPEQFVLFTTKSKIDITKDYQLLPDYSGNVSVYKPFWDIIDYRGDYGNNWDWNINTNRGGRTVDPVLIYAQLIYSGNERNLETAQLIYNEYIKPNL